MMRLFGIAVCLGFGACLGDDVALLQGQVDLHQEPVVENHALSKALEAVEKAVEAVPVKEQKAEPTQLKIADKIAKKIAVEEPKPEPLMQAKLNQVPAKEHGEKTDAFLEAVEKSIKAVPVEEPKAEPTQLKIADKIAEKIAVEEPKPEPLMQAKQNQVPAKEHGEKTEALLEAVEKSVKAVLVEEPKAELTQSKIADKIAEKIAEKTGEHGSASPEEQKKKQEAELKKKPAEKPVERPKTIAEIKAEEQKKKQEAELKKKEKERTEALARMEKFAEEAKAAEKNKKVPTEKELKEKAYYDQLDRQEALKRLEYYGATGHQMDEGNTTAKTWMTKPYTDKLYTKVYSSPEDEAEAAVAKIKANMAAMEQYVNSGSAFKFQIKRVDKRFLQQAVYKLKAAYQEYLDRAGIKVKL